MREKRGITLIALVITIIVLLILAGISIATLTGQNGILNKANTATEENKKAEYEETIKLIGNGLRPEKVLENLGEEEFMDRYQRQLEKETEKRWKIRRSSSREKRSRKNMGDHQRRMGL